MAVKVCELCKEDCSDRPRTKDRRGRYYCTACYEVAIAERRENAPAPPAAPPPAPSATPRARSALNISPLWMSLALLGFFGLLAVLGAMNAVSLRVMVVALLLYTVGVYVLIVVRAFGRGVGSGLLCLFVPLFIGYFGLVKDGNRYVRHALMVASLGVVLLLGAFAVRVVSALGEGGGLASLIGPQVRDPTMFHNRRWRFDYPGNWIIDFRAEGHDNFGHLTVEAPQDAYCRLMLYTPERSLEDEIDASAQMCGESYSSFTETDPFTTWGRYQGVGRTFTAMTEGRSYTLRIFGTVLPDDDVLEVWECSFVDQRELLEPGYALIRETLSVTPE